MAFPQPFSGGDPGSPPDILDLIGTPNTPSTQKVILDSRNSDDKKLSPAEIQRRKINAASEYYRKLRENSIGPPPPLIPNSEVKAGNSQLQSSSGSGQQIGSQYETSQQELVKPNIDLGAVVRSTIINGVTKAFSQVCNMSRFRYWTPNPKLCFLRTPR